MSPDAKPVSVDALFPSAGKWFLEAETRPPQAGPRGRPFGLSGRAFSLPAGKPTGNDDDSSEVWVRVEFRTNGWWRTQSGETGLRDRARLGNREKHTVDGCYCFFWGSPKRRGLRFSERLNIRLYNSLADHEAR